MTISARFCLSSVPSGDDFIWQSSVPSARFCPGSVPSGDDFIWQSSVPSARFCLSSVPSGDDFIWQSSVPSGRTFWQNNLFTAGKTQSLRCRVHGLFALFFFLQQSPFPSA